MFDVGGSVFPPRTFPEGARRGTEESQCGKQGVPPSSVSTTMFKNISLVNTFGPQRSVVCSWPTFVEDNVQRNTLNRICKNLVFEIELTKGSCQ